MYINHERSSQMLLKIESLSASNHPQLQSIGFLKGNESKSLHYCKLPASSSPFTVMAIFVRNAATVVLNFVGKLALAPDNPTLGRPLVVRLALITDLNKKIRDVPVKIFLLSICDMLLITINSRSRSW